MAYSGRYVVKNPEKYKGELSKITYRSNWEKFFMKHCDNHPDIVQWSSEETVIPYFSNADGKRRRYFMDFWFKRSDGQEFLVEVKPKKETVPPVKPAHLTVASKRKFMNELYTFQVNTDKWTAASALAEKKGMKFKVLTEVGLKRLGYTG